MREEQRLYYILRKLNPSGPNGFEGLIAKLFQALTGRRFFLARSGYQGGRDFSTGGCEANVIAVECKRFFRDTEFNDREILGELEDASQTIPDLDLWILVTTRSVPDQLRIKLSISARKKAIECLIVETADYDPGTLAMLCASGREITSKHIEENLPSDSGKEFLEALDCISVSPEFENHLKKIKESLSEAIGFDNWRSNQNNWLTRQFSSERESRAMFGQVLNILDQDVKLVRRLTAWNDLDNWFGSWTSTYSTFVLLGEEGDGKTWAISSWLSTRIHERDRFPAIVLVASKNLNSYEPHTLLSSVLSKQAGSGDQEFWSKRLSQWLKRPIISSPYMLLIFDGVNERVDFNWRSLLEGLDVDPWKGRVAVAVTSRSFFWNKHFTPLKHLGFSTSSMTAFDDEELNIALSNHGLKVLDIPESLLPLVRKPRYMDLVIKYRHAMKESGDITVERLIYEDWRDRIRRKSVLPAFSHEDFQVLIKNLAQRCPVGVSITEHDINVALSPFIEHRNAVFQELVSGGIIVSDHIRRGSYKVDKRRLVHGFGALLAERVHEAAHEGEPVIDEVIAEFLEPQADMDIKVLICGAAAFHSLIVRDFPEVGRVALLKAWLKGRNFDTEVQDSLFAYFPLAPETYMELAEYFWSDTVENSSIQDLLMCAFLRWRDHLSIQKVFTKTFERWMGFINPYGFSFMRGLHNSKRNDAKKEIADRLGRELSLGTLLFGGYTFVVTEDDGALRLARVALAIISHLPRGIFIRSFVLWALSRTIMGHPNEYELVKWVLRTAPDDFWTEFEKEIRNLIAEGNVIRNQSAYRLLSCQGSPEAYGIKETLPKELFPPHPFKTIYEESPCSQSLFLWGEEVYRECIEKQDIPPSTIATKLQEIALNPGLSVPANMDKRLAPIEDRVLPAKIWCYMGRTIEDHFLEQIEPAMCAFAPHSYARIIRNIMRDVTNREDLALRQLSWRLKENSLLLSQAEREALTEVWLRISKKSEALSEAEKVAESRLLFHILAEESAEKQLHIILNRQGEAWDLLDYEPLFIAISSDAFEAVLSDLTFTLDMLRTRRLLWFLSAHPERIPLTVLERITSLLAAQDSFDRALVLKILYKSGHLQLTSDFVRGTWMWKPDCCEEETYWGSLLLCEFGSELPYREIRARIYPTYWGYAVQQRGLLPEEIAQYCEDVDTMWNAIITGSAPVPQGMPAVEIVCEKGNNKVCLEQLNLSASAYSRSFHFLSRDCFWGGTSFFSNVSPDVMLNPITEDKSRRLHESVEVAIREQHQAGNRWFSRRFHISALKEAISLRPDLCEKWIEAVLEETPEARRLMFLCEDFYRTLCEALFEVDPIKAVALYNLLKTELQTFRVIDSSTGMDLLKYSLFSAKETEEIIDLWFATLKYCSTDNSLLELALVVQESMKSSWLIDRIKDGLNSTRLLEQAKALVLLGFMDGEEAGSRIKHYLEESRASWVTHVAESSFKRWQKNEWAKHWFSKFLEIADDVIACASFKLFLQCVDHRFWLWAEQFRNTRENVESAPDRWKFVDLNQDTIKKNIASNEAKLNDTFLWEKTHKNEVWPWMEAYAKC